MKAAKLVEMARNDGLIAKLLYAIWTRPLPGQEITPDLIAAHMTFLKKLESEGVLFGAGPIFDSQEENHIGEGLIILKASSLSQAEAFANEDPMHASGVRTFELRPWLLNEGTLKL